MPQYDAVVSCLPYHFNLEISKRACRQAVHYFDLTEDLPTTKAIIKLSKSANSILAPQCGLAPGFIGIVGAALVEKFDKIKSLKLRVVHCRNTRPACWDMSLTGHRKAS